MRKVLATIIKEWQLMRRDISGLILLLVMPAILIIIMALIQDAPFRDYQELSFDMLVTDNDHGSVARQIVAGLKQSHSFHITDSIGGAPLTERQLKQLLNKGTYKIGVVIPDGITAEVVNSSNIAINNISSKIGLGLKMPSRAIRGQMFVRLYFDPVSKPAFRNAINSALDKFITASCSDILFQRLSLLNKDSKNADTSDLGDLKKVLQGIGVREQPVNDSGKYGLHINSVQHNVPAWAIFGMFFIAIPIAGHIIKEREDGSALRIALIPGVTRFVALGKIIFYTLICLLQFIFMMAIGLWLMPYFNLPALYPGTHPWLLLPVALCIGFATTSYGFFIGTVFKTATQALMFSSVSIVVLSAIGGIWVPVEILPPGMQTVALASPLHWSLDAVNQVILRNGDIFSILLPCFILIATGSILWAASLSVKYRQS